MSIYSLAFAGTAGNRVTVPASASIDSLNPLTISFWVYRLDNATGSIADKSDGNLNNGEYGIATSVSANGDIKYTREGTITNGSRTTSTTYPANTWTHVAITWDGSNTATNWHIYFNGVECSYASAINNSGTSTGSGQILFIGAGRATISTTTPINGYVTQYAIWGAVLTADQIGQLAAGVDPATIGTPAAVFETTEGSGTSLADTSGNANNGTLTGSTAWQSSIPAQLTSGVQYSQFSGNSGYETSTSFSGAALWYGNNRMLSIDVALLSVNDTVTAMTYGGANCTLVQAQNVAGGTGRVECWRICQNDSGAPAIGSNTLSVTISGTLANAILWVGRINVNQSSPTEAPNGASGIATGTTASATITTITANDVVHAALATNTASGVACGQTQRNNVNGALGTGADEDTGPVVTPGATTMTFTSIGSLAAWAVAGYGVKPLGAASGHLFRTATLDGLGGGMQFTNPLG